MKTAVEEMFVAKARRYNAAFCRCVAPSDRAGGLRARRGMGEASGRYRSAICASGCSAPGRGSRASPNSMHGWKISASPPRKRTRHPEFKERTIWEVFQEERTSLMELRGPFDGLVRRR